MAGIWIFISVLCVFCCTARADAEVSEDLPRFMSLRSDLVNLRSGPSKATTIQLIYKKAGLPIELISSYGLWRKIRDYEGSEGWVYHSLLSSKRTAITLKPLGKKRTIPLYQQIPPSTTDAYIEPGVICSLSSCDGTWCEVTIKTSNNTTISGYLKQNLLWGVYPNESF